MKKKSFQGVNNKEEQLEEEEFCLDFLKGNDPVFNHAMKKIDSMYTYVYQKVETPTAKKNQCKSSEQMKKLNINYQDEEIMQEQWNKKTQAMQKQKYFLKGQQIYRKINGKQLIKDQEQIFLGKPLDRLQIRNKIY